MSATYTQTTELLADFESLWQCIDAHLASLGPADWSRPHGKHWTFADVPYHLAYFDHDVVAYPLALGLDLPASERWAALSPSELNAWNARKFAERPPTQTVEESIAQMQASRDDLRRIVGEMTDGNLDRPAWFPLLVGDFVRARLVLDGGRAHTWAHEAELRLRLGRTDPVPRPSAIHAAIGTLMGFFPIGLNREVAATTDFTLVMELTGPAGGAWTIRVADGDCTVAEERAARADLVITQSPDTFLKTRTEIHNPMEAMQTGEIRIQGVEHMGTFTALFPPD